MTYVYKCSNSQCSKVFDVTKPVRDLDVNEFCPRPGCQSPAERQFTARVHLMNTGSEDAAYDPAFGTVIKSKQHRKDLAKQRGYIEVGNEKPDTIEKHFQNQRDDKHKRKWEDDR